MPEQLDGGGRSPVHGGLQQSGTEADRRTSHGDSEDQEADAWAQTILSKRTSSISCVTGPPLVPPESSTQIGEPLSQSLPGGKPQRRHSVKVHIRVVHCACPV